MQTAKFRIWIRVALSISHNDNRYTKSAFIYIDGYFSLMELANLHILL